MPPLPNTTVRSHQRSCKSSVSFPSRGKRKNLWHHTSQNYVVLLQFQNYNVLWTRYSGTDSYGAVKNDSIQKKLLQEKDLTFQRALVITQRSEVADQNLRDMKAPKQELNSNSKGVTVKCGPVHKVSRRNSNTKNMGGTCDHCGTPGHLATACRFQDQTCHKCRKRGHLAKVCRQSKFNPKQPPLGAKLKRPVSQPV